jgi:Dolichyl-phosphate-mannose-protein mannosyltransferase
VSRTEQDSQEPLVGMATVAVWRRREQACSVVVPADSDEESTNGLQGSIISGDEDDHANSSDAAKSDGAVNGDQGSNALHPAASNITGNGRAGSNGSHVSVADGALEVDRGELADSQKAGLTAIIRIAGLEASAPEIPAVGPVGTRDPRTGTDSAEPRDEREILRNRSLSLVSVLSLAIILTVQAVISLRLVWSNTAYTDEALYLWAGRMEWTHWLHGSPIPALPTFFSGAPVIYPPASAIADSIDGLAGARILSLFFMLGATSLLWSTTSRLYGRRAGFFAAGLWAFLGPTLKLGAFATFDAMSLFLLALAVWFGVRAGPRRESMPWTFAAAGALVLANATAYSTAIFDPVVIAIVLLAWWPLPTSKQAAMRAASVGAYTVAGLILLATIGGSLYGVGIIQTVLSRANGNNPPSLVLSDAAKWTTPIMTGAVAGLVICLVAERQRGRFAMLLILVCSVFLAPIEQARIHTITSLDKHTDFGAWFAAIAAGYAIAKLCDLLRWKSLRVMGCLAGAAALFFPANLGWGQAQALYDWPNTAQFVSVLRPLIRQDPGPLLVETPSPARYYLSGSVPWEDWSSTWSITLPDGKSTGEQLGLGAAGQPAVYKDFLQKGYFAIVALNWEATPGFDELITEDLGGHYHYVTSVPYGASRYVIWERTTKEASQ